MLFTLRPSTPQDLPVLVEIIAQARRAIAELGIDQWQDGSPGAATLQADIHARYSWLALAGATPIATAALLPGPDADYLPIAGAWHTPESYMAIHRFALADAARGTGVAQRFYTQLEQQAKQQGCTALRIDTHHGNLRMRRFLQKCGFTQCGDVTLSGGLLRLAFDKSLC